MTDEPIVFVLRHTHWDREWYHPASVFRKRLVDLIDELLGEPPNGTFLLDGQAIVLQDYMKVRPEQAAELAAALHNARVEAGPWFVLPDELVPSGEALVRNLLAGRRALRTLRAQPPPLLYSPDSFGHPAALPAIAAGFGCGTIIVWRGYGSRRFPPGDSARWTAPNGQEALLFHLSPSGYELGANLPTTDALAQRRFADMRRVLESRSALGVWLVPNGADHHAPQRDSDAAIAALVRAVAPNPVQVGGLAELTLLLEQRAERAALPRVAGELRDSYGYTWTLQGTFATRAHQKRANARAERDLLRDGEPWAALARLRGAPSVRHHVHSAWETLLTCHPHDSLCGCSADAIAQAVDQRLADTALLAVELREAAIAAIFGHDADAARQNATSWKRAVVVRNRAPRSRHGIAEIELDVELRSVPVGPGSAGRARAVSAAGTLAVPTQVLSRERRYARIEAPRYYPINYEVERRRCLAWLPPIPAYGLLSLPLADRVRAPRELPGVVRADARGVHNEAGSLTISRSAVVWLGDGSVSKAKPLFGFEIVGDRGDTYTHSPIPGTLRRAKMASSRVVARGPLRGAIDTTWRITKGGGPKTDLHARAALDAGADFVRLTVEGVNRASDYRLRLLIHTGLRPRRVLADAAFVLIERKPLRVPARDQRAESVLPTAPLHRFVTLFDGRRGCTVVSDGLAEYEVLDDGTVAITLVRAVGELSRDDLPERPGHAGWPMPTPLAQSPGPFRGEFAIAWHAGDSSALRARIVELVDDVLLPLTGETHRDLTAIPPPISGLALEGDGLAFSTLKESDDGHYVVARCVNVTGGEVRGAWVFPQPVAAAHLGRLDETPIAPLEVSGNGTRVPIAVPAHGIHTVLLVVDG